MNIMLLIFKLDYILKKTLHVYSIFKSNSKLNKLYTIFQQKIYE